MATLKLYEKNIYQKSCDAMILNTYEEEAGIFIELDQTIFYPEGGGQPSDIGVIGDANVVDVMEKEDVILHKVDKKPSKKKVHCQLDWERRLDNMQQHCGEHILSGIILKHYQGANKGFRIGEDYITIDIDLPEITPQMLEHIEMEANKAIYENVPIHIHFANDIQEAEQYPVRKKITVDEDIRIVEIQGVDCVACCGSHPETTGDVGLLKILKSEKYKGMTRLYFKCGMRALKDYQKKHDIVTELCQKYSAEVDNVLERMKKDEEKVTQLRDKYHQMKKKMNDLESEKLIDTAKDGMIVGELKGFDPEDLTAISKRLLESGDFTVLLSTDTDNKVVLTHNGEKELHCGKLFKAHIKECNGRGGGGDRMAQGVFSSYDDVVKFVELLKQEII